MENQTRRWALPTALMVSAVVWGACTSVEAVTISSQSESQAFAGVTVVEGVTTSPSTEFYAAFIELCHDYVHVDASADHAVQASGQWAQSQGAQLAVNGDFFAWDDHGFHVYGDAVGGGSQWPVEHTGLHVDYSNAWFYERHGWIAFGDDFVEYSNTEWIKQRWEKFGADQGWQPKSVTQQIPEGTRALVSGFPQLVVEGQPIECSSPTDSSCFPDRSDMRDRHPRTAMGLTEDRNTFILVAVDGRNAPTSVGMYGTELADLMHQLGAHTAINLDGGGSTQMWLQGQGTINNPSDGSPRSVPNSWGIFAGGSGGMPRVPGSCDRTYDDLLYQAHVRDHSGHTDIDGSEKADVCIRGPGGIECHTAEADGTFSGPVDGPNLADDSGWSDPSNHSTIRMGDITGDGHADLCARRNAGMRCYFSDGVGFDGHVDGPQWSDDEGFDDIRYFSTIRMADVTGDGRAELCARTSEGFECHVFDGDDFDQVVQGPNLSDDTGWGVPWHYGTIRMGDVTGNGHADVCARRNADFSCWPSEGDGFGSRIEGPKWSNANGFDGVEYWSTIELVDLDGDDSADVCARTPDGVVCHRIDSDGFGPEIEGPALADDSGWDDYTNYSTMRFADVTGNGNADLCARQNNGMRCWMWTQDGFDDLFNTDLMANDTGWYRERFFRTIRFADITGDGRDDLCARASAGWVCWPSQADGFADQPTLGPAWSDDDGWDDPDYYTTIRLASPCPAGGCSDDDDGANGDDDLDAGQPSEPDGGAAPDAGQPPPDTDQRRDANGDDDSSSHTSSSDTISTSSCATHTGNGGGWPAVVVGLFAALALIRRSQTRRRRPNNMDCPPGCRHGLR